MLEEEPRHIGMEAGLDRIVCAKQQNYEGQVNAHPLQLRSPQLHAIPEHTQVYHDGVCDLGIPSCHDDATCELLSLPSDRIAEVEQPILAMIDDVYSGQSCHLAGTIAQMQLENREELEIVARILVWKALAEPQQSEACAVLACTLHTYLPSLPDSSHRGKTTEKFMHALLDVLQTEFETLFMNPDELNRRDNYALQDRIRVERAALHFAGHLHRGGLLGNGVLSQMVQVLVESGEVESARELLQVVGVSLDSSLRGNPDVQGTLS